MTKNSVSFLRKIKQIKKVLIKINQNDFLINQINQKSIFCIKRRIVVLDIKFKIAFQNISIFVECISNIENQ